MRRGSNLQLALITGGAGFIGSHLAQKLLERGYRVRVLDSLVPQVHGPERRFPSHLDPRVECILGDIRDKEIVSSALREVDLVFHLAALTGASLCTRWMRIRKPTSVAQPRFCDAWLIGIRG
jgi:nucleoside-diphosphate-sugar epimerase